jgi:serine protease
MRRIYLFILILLPFLGSFSSYSQDVPKVKNIPGKIVFKLKPQFKPGGGTSIYKLEKLNGALESIQLNAASQKFMHSMPPEDQPEAVDLSLIYQVALKEGISLEKACATLVNTGLVEYAEAMRMYEPLAQPNDPLADSTSASRQDYLKNIRAYRGWDFEQGDTSIVIGILDTGVRYTHKDLAKNIKYNYADPIDGVDNDNDGYIDNFRGWDTAENDNNATAANGHGLGVTGISSAQTNNGKGIAGVGFKCKFLPIKIYASTLNGTFAGYEAIVYAANHGCHVINLSWGGVAAPSRYEQDVINYAVINKNAVVVAAAGNTNAELVFYPASYYNVISVGGSDINNLKAAPLTYSHQIDLVAPGLNTLTTGNGNDSAYVIAAGSSMSAPMVAGAAALVKKKFPQFNAQQIGEQLRVTGNISIYNLAGNAAYADMLGHGLLDVAKALSTTNAKSVRFTRIQPNKQQYSANDTLKLEVDFKNYLQPLSNLTVSITSASPYVTITQPTFNAGAMATLTSKTTVKPFKIYIKQNTPLNEKVALRFNFSDGTYTDFQYYEIVLNQDFVTVDINKVAVTITSKGNVGFQEYNPDLGQGVRYRGHNLISEAGLMIGNAPTTVSDNIRNGNNTNDANFVSQANVHFNTSASADMEAEGSMQDSYPASGQVGVGVNYRAYAWQNAPNDKFVIIEYRIKNLQTSTISNLYAGMFADWDIFDSAKNYANYHSATNTGYVYNVKSDTLLAGIKLLSPGAPSFYALENTGSPTGTINISDGFTEAEKYQALSGGLARLTAGSLALGNDVAYVIGSKLPDLAPNATSTFAVAILAGESVADLAVTAQAAQTKYNQRVLSTKDEIANQPLIVYPNPATTNLYIKIPANLGPADLTLTDPLGRIIGGKKGQSGETVAFSTENLAAGMYFIRADYSKGTSVQKVQIIK